MREYWVVDPERDTVAIDRRTADGSFPRVAELSAKALDTLESPLLPGWSLTLPRLFRSS